jgi:hypothetical protein
MHPLTPHQTQAVTGSMKPKFTDDNAALKPALPRNQPTGFDPFFGEYRRNTGSGWFVAPLTEPIEATASIEAQTP